MKCLFLAGARPRQQQGLGSRVPGWLRYKAHWERAEAGNQRVSGNGLGGFSLVGTENVLGGPRVLPSPCWLQAFVGDSSGGTGGAYGHLQNHPQGMGSGGAEERSLWPQNMSPWVAAGS